MPRICLAASRHTTMGHFQRTLRFGVALLMALIAGLTADTDLLTALAAVVIAGVALTGWYPGVCVVAHLKTNPPKTHPNSSGHPAEDVGFTQAHRHCDLTKSTTSGDSDALC